MSTDEDGTIPEVKAADGNIYRAYGGLRLKKSIDGFGANGRIYSICEANLAPVMAEVGKSISAAIAQNPYPVRVPVAPGLATPERGPEKHSVAFAWAPRT